MTPRIEKAIDIFLDAINEGTLAKGSCAHCAVGNLAADTLEIKLGFPKNTDKAIDNPNAAWSALFCTDIFGSETYNPMYNKHDAYVLISKMSFNLNELKKIEKAFEANTDIVWYSYSSHTPEEIRADQIRGLEAVVKVMLEFDNAKEDYKEVFTKRAELIPL